MNPSANRIAKVLAAGLLGAGVAATVAAPVLNGEAQIYGSIKHSSPLGGHAAPAPAAELLDVGTVRSFAERGSQPALMSAQNFGLYGGDLSYPGVANFNGQRIDGTDLLLFYEQPYRTTTASDRFTAALFDLAFGAVDATGRSDAYYEAGFALDMWITTFDPLGPDFDSVDEPAGAFWYTRMAAGVRGRANDWTALPLTVCREPSCFLRDTYSGTLSFQGLGASVNPDDAAIELNPIGLPAGTEFWLTQRLTMRVEGTRGEGLARASAWDPVRGAGIRLVGAQSNAVPAPGAVSLALLGLAAAAWGCRRRHRPPAAPRRPPYGG